MIARALASLCLTIAAAAASYPTSAAVLSLRPVDQTVPLGTSASVVLGISDFLPGGLGSYQFTLGFDPAILSSSGLADRLNMGFAVGAGFLAGADAITVNDTSLEATADLVALQIAAVDTTGFLPLVEFTFDTIGLGTSPLSLRLAEGCAADFQTSGICTLLTLETTNGSITVTQATGVPEPATSALAGLALLSLAWAGRRRLAHLR